MDWPSQCVCPLGSKYRKPPELGKASEFCVCLNARREPKLCAAVPSCGAVLLPACFPAAGTGPGGRPRGGAAAGHGSMQ